MLPDSLRAHQPPDTPEVEQEIHICAVDGKVIVRNIVTGHEAKFPPGSRAAVLRVFGAQVPHQGGSSQLMLPMLALLAARAPRSKSNEWTQEAADAWVSAAELERYRASNTRPRWSQVLSWLRRLQDTGLVQYQVGSNTERTKPRARFCVPASFDPPLDGSPTEQAVDQWLRAHADVEYQPKRSPATWVSTSLDERQPVDARSADVVTAPLRSAPPPDVLVTPPKPDLLSIGTVEDKYELFRIVGGVRGSRVEYNRETIAAIGDVLKSSALCPDDISVLRLAEELLLDLAGRPDAHPTVLGILATMLSSNTTRCGLNRKADLTSVCRKAIRNEEIVHIGIVEPLQFAVSANGPPDLQIDYLTSVIEHAPLRESDAARVYAYYGNRIESQLAAIARHIEERRGRDLEAANDVARLLHLLTVEEVSGNDALLRATLRLLETSQRCLYDAGQDKLAREVERRTMPPLRDAAASVGLAFRRKSYPGARRPKPAHSGEADTETRPGGPRPARGMSVWLAPAEPDFTTFQLTIRALAAVNGTPTFAPHVTLVGEITGPPSRLEAAARLFAVTPPLSLRLLSARGLDEFYRYLFLPVAKSDDLWRLRDTTLDVLGLPVGEAYDPHLSLMYGVLPARARAAAVARVGGSHCGEVIFDAVWIVASVGMPDAWDVVAKVALR